MAEDSPIDALVASFGESIVARAQRNLGATRTVKGKKRRAVATGTLKNSLSYVNLSRNGKIVLQFTAKGVAKSYADPVEFGRGKNKTPPPVSAIEAWIKQKPIRLQDKKKGGFAKMTPQKIRSAAFAIARKIGKDGIEPVRYYRDAIEGELDERGDEFYAAIKKDIELRLNLR